MNTAPHEQLQPTSSHAIAQLFLLLDAREGRFGPIASKLSRRFLSSCNLKNLYEIIQLEEHRQMPMFSPNVFTEVDSYCRQNSLFNRVNSSETPTEMHMLWDLNDSDIFVPKQSEKTFQQNARFPLIMERWDMSLNVTFQDQFSMLTFGYHEAQVVPLRSRIFPSPAYVLFLSHLLPLINKVNSPEDVSLVYWLKIPLYIRSLNHELWFLIRLELQPGPTGFLVYMQELNQTSHEAPVQKTEPKGSVESESLSFSRENLMLPQMDRSEESPLESQGRCNSDITIRYSSQPLESSRSNSYPNLGKRRREE